MTTLNLGRVRPVWKGDWTSTATYLAFDFVRYTYQQITSRAPSLITGFCSARKAEKAIQVARAVWAPREVKGPEV